MLLLGSNLGDREANLAIAREAIGQRIGAVDRESSLYETAAWGKTDQGAFLNQVVSGMTSLSATGLLTEILSIETSMGRVRQVKWSPRVIDIDILFLDDQCIELPDLTIPHPMLHLRRFTLVPLCEIFPDFRHPVFGKPLSALLESLEDPLEVHQLGRQN